MDGRPALDKKRLLSSAQDCLYPFDHGFGVEFASNNLIRTIAFYGDAIIPDKNDLLSRTDGLDFLAELFGSRYSPIALDVDDHEMILANSSHLEGVVKQKSGVHLVAVEFQNLIANFQNCFSAAHVEDRLCRVAHAG